MAERVPLVYVDTSVWLQVINGDEPHEMADRVMLAAAAGRINIVASWLVRAEIQSVADPSIPQDVIDAVTRLLDAEGIRWVAVDRFVAQRATELSASLPRRLAGADAVHLATAVIEGADYFMTFDEGFPIDSTVDGVAVSRPKPVWPEDLFESATSASSV